MFPSLAYPFQLLFSALTTARGQEEIPKVPGIISRHSRARAYEVWRADYESVVKVVTFKHSEMLKRLDIPTDKVEFTCSNDACIYSGKVFSLEEVAISSLLTTRARERQSTSGVIDAGTLAAPGAGAGSKAGGAGAGAGAEGDGAGANVGGAHTAFRCTYCTFPMRELTATVDGLSAGELKRQFNEQVDEINEAMRDVERLLKERHEVLAARGAGAEVPAVGAGGGGSGGSATGVGAKVGYSSAADLANVRPCGFVYLLFQVSLRYIYSPTHTYSFYPPLFSVPSQRVEKNKSLLAWDRLTADDRAARERDEAARKAAAEEAAAKLAEANEIRAREVRLIRVLSTL